MTNMNLEWERSTDAAKRWTTSNTETNVPRNGFYYSKYGGYINDHFIENASFVRLKNVTLGYTLPFKKIISSCRIYASAENLFTITGYSGWDPEIDTKANEVTKGGGSFQTANAGAGLDFNAYPSMNCLSTIYNGLPLRSLLMVLPLVRLLPDLFLLQLHLLDTKWQEF